MRTFIFTLITALSLALAGLGPARAAAIEEAVIDQVQGQAQVIGAGGQSRPAAAGGYVLSGEAVQTQANSSVRLVLPDGSVLMVRENSRVAVLDSRTTEKGSSSVALYFGRLWASIAKSADGSTTLEITTPTAVAGVRGTVFSAGVGLDGATRVGVDEGRVDVASDAGELMVDAGNETTVELDAKPSPPAKYDGDDAKWRDWVLARQDQLVKNGARIVPMMLRDVKQSRENLKELRQNGDTRFQRLRKYAAEQRLEGKPVRLTPAQRRALRQQLMESMRAVRQLAVADRKMMVRYQLLLKIQADAQANPGVYSPELVQTVNQAVAELQKIGIDNIHDQDQKIIDGYVEYFQKLRAQAEDNPSQPEDRKARLEQARKARQENKQ